MNQCPREQKKAEKARASGHDVHTPWNGLTPPALNLNKDSHSKGVEMTHLLLDRPYSLCKDASQPSSSCDLRRTPVLSSLGNSQPSRDHKFRCRLLTGLTSEVIQHVGRHGSGHTHVHLYLVRDTLGTQKVTRD